MTSIKNCNRTDDPRTESYLSNSRLEHDSEHTRPVYFISDKNLRAQLSAYGVDSDGQDLQTCKSECNIGEKVAKSKSVPDRRVIDRSTLKRLKSKAVVVTAKDRRKMAEDLMADRERLENESAARKQKLQSYDVMRAKGKRLAQVGVTNNSF